MKHKITIFAVIGFIIFGWWFVFGVIDRNQNCIITGAFLNNQNFFYCQEIESYKETNKENSNFIQPEKPVYGEILSSEVEFSGQARGYWFFEASFPVDIIDLDGNVLAQSYATAQEPWMTEDFIPYEGKITITNIEKQTKVLLVLKRDNPSGLSENDAEIIIPVVLK